MNPYTQPLPENDCETDTSANPAKPLLLLIGGIYTAYSPLAFLSGLQAGVHMMVGAVAMFVLGGATIWISLLDFTPKVRFVTIGWGLMLSAFFAYVTMSTFGEIDMDIEGLVFFVIALIVVVPIPILAFVHKPYPKRTTL